MATDFYAYARWKTKGFGKSWIYRQIQLQQFPPSIRLNSRHVAWLESEVDAWIHQRIRLTRDV
ncbi:helix-turn-helix transcriptional regulator [Klebsiella pneumoniae]|uniref:helix-turn-helix transcriptional regulator n=1 Tax=Klebsiella pneumoniae TaxID=573 RepID=UPI003558EE66